MESNGSLLGYVTTRRGKKPRKVVGTVPIDINNADYVPVTGSDKGLNKVVNHERFDENQNAHLTASCSQTCQATRVLRYHSSATSDDATNLTNGNVMEECKVEGGGENTVRGSQADSLSNDAAKIGGNILYKLKYIAITNHILWDIITNGDQATTEPASSSRQPSAPKTSIIVNARRNNEKALNILLSAIPERHLLSFHDAQDAQSLWAAIKARFGAREELDSAYDRFQNIISMLELYDAKVSCEDANLKFLRSLPPVWHVVATMIRGQPGLDELDFDDLYNNLKVYEHELKGASSSNSQSIAFMSAEIKGSTSRQSTADDKSEIITKGYAQASSSKLKETLNSSFNSDEIICSFFAQQASMPETHDDEDLLQIDDDAMEEIDIRWQVAMITARIRKFMRKTGRPIDLKPKNGITFDKSKIECFNCQKLGHFARECKFAKYQANRANGSKEKRIVPIEDSNSKALVAKDSQGEIDWTKEFDDDPVTFAMVALNGIEEDDWSIEIDADHVDLGQDGLGVFDWSEEADNAPVALALMATSSTDSSNSEVPYCSNCSKSYKKLLNDYQTEMKREKAYKAVPPPTGTIIPPRADVAFTGIDELAIRNKVINKQNSESSGTDHESCESKKRDDLIKNKEQTQINVKSKLIDTETSSENKSPRSRDSFGQRSRRRGLGYRDGKGNPRRGTKRICVIDSGCSGSMTGDKDKLSDFKDYKGGYVAFGNDPKGGRITGKGTIKTSCRFENVYKLLSPEFKIVDENLVLLRAPRKNDVYSLNLKSIIPFGGITCLVAKASEDEAILWHRRLGHVNFKNINKLVKRNLVRGLPSKTFKHDHSCMACRKGKQHKASCKKLEERTVREPLELLHIDLFGPVSVASLNRKKYCLVVTNDCSRFSWVFFLVYKDETYDILHDLIVGLENKLRQKVESISVDDDLPKDGIFHGNSFDDENKDTEDKIDLDINNMDNTINELKQKQLRYLYPTSSIVGFICKQNRIKSQRSAECLFALLFISRRNPRRYTSIARWIVGLKIARRTASVQAKECIGLCDVPDGKLSYWNLIGSSETKEMKRGFEDPAHHPNKVYKVIKALYGLHQAPRAWSTKTSMVKEFEELMQKEFTMSSLGFSFHLEAFSDSDYARDNHDRRSTSGGCQYLGRRLVSWQCKKQTIVAISSTEAEYVAAASCCGQVLWMQNQLFDYGFNFMNTDIHIDNESTICIVKNPVFHSKTKHIQIRHHFIRDCYDQRLINVVKVQLFGSQYWNDEPIATFKGRTACKVWTLKEDLMLFLRGGIKSEMIDFLRYDEIVVIFATSCDSGLDLKRCYLR
ncbi:putative ribonuclease H-like domain-containing protein [Tanacetum coccineum]